MRTSERGSATSALTAVELLHRTMERQSLQRLATEETTVGRSRRTDSVPPIQPPDPVPTPPMPTPSPLPPVPGPATPQPVPAPPEPIPPKPDPRWQRPELRLVTDNV